MASASRVDVDPLLGADVLPHDRMPDDRHGSGPRPAEPVGKPGRGMRPIDGGRVVHSDPEGGAQPLEPFDPVSPDVGRQVQPPRCGSRVDRQRIAAGTFDDVERPGEVGPRVVAPRRLQPKLRVVVAEYPVVDGVGVAVDVEVESGAGTDVEQADRQAGARGDDQQHADEGRAPADVVGLHRSTSEVGEVGGSSRYRCITAAVTPPTSRSSAIAASSVAYSGEPGRQCRACRRNCCDSGCITHLAQGG